MTADKEADPKTDGKSEPADSNPEKAESPDNPANTPEK